MELSGASATLDKTLLKMDKEMIFVKEQLYPAIRNLERREKYWDFVTKSHSSNQKERLEKYGYTFLEPSQLKLMYEKSGKYSG